MRIHHATIAKAKKFQITLTVEDNEVVATNKKGERLASGLQGNKVLEDAITKQTGKPAKGNPIKAAVDALVVAGKIATQSSRKPVAGADPYEAAAKEDGWKKTRWGFSKESEESVQADGWQALCEDQGIEIETDEPEDDEEETGTKSMVKAKYKAKYKPNKNRCGDALSHRMNAHCSRENDAGEMRIDLKALRSFAKANECWVEGYSSLKSRTGTFNGGAAMMNVNNRLRARLRKIAKTEDRKFDIDKDIAWN